MKLESICLYMYEQRVDTIGTHRCSTDINRLSTVVLASMNTFIDISQAGEQSLVYFITCVTLYFYLLQVHV